MRIKHTFYLTIFLFLLALFYEKKVFAKEISDFKGQTFKESFYKNDYKKVFEENKGQVQGEDGNRVSFTVKSSGLDIFIFNNGISYQFQKAHYPKNYEKLLEEKNAYTLNGVGNSISKLEESIKDVKIETFRMDALLMGTNNNVQVIKEGKSKNYNHYYNLDALDVFTYEKITYKNIYNNIDWVIFFREGKLEYEFIVYPGGNPADIKMQYLFADEVELQPDGDIMLKSSLGNIIDKAPISFQNGRAITTSYKLDGNIMQFDIASYDRSQMLTVDPVVEWATYYGGTNIDQPSSTAIDNAGNVYIAGRTSSVNSIASGGHQVIHGGGGLDAFLVKFDHAGVRLWGSYYGGSGYEFGNSCAVDLAGNVYLAGSTVSSNGISTPGSFQPAIGIGHADAFLVKFNAAGVRQWGTYYGGNGFDNAVSCTTDALGNVYLAGNTESFVDIASGGHQNSHGGVVVNMDAYLVKFNAAGVRQWATYYGGTGNDNGTSCAVDALGNVYLAGETVSTNNIASVGHQNTFGGGLQDAFLVKFDASGTRLWSTYYGGSGHDRATGCSVDNYDNVYLVGFTTSLNNIASGGHQNIHGGAYDAYLVKFNASGGRDWGTYYGGNQGDYFWSSCDFDAMGNIYLGGDTHSTNDIASGGFQNSIAGAMDVFLVMFDNSGVRQWSSYYGSTGDDAFASISVNSNTGDVYILGQTNSINSISTSGSHQPTFGGGLVDAFLLKISECVPIVSTDTVVICINQLPYVWNGIVNAQTGVVYATQTNYGCDSLVSLNLIVNSSVYSIDSVTICSNQQPYLWNGISSAQSGAIFTAQSSTGCDSIVTLNLTVNPVVNTPENITICSNQQPYIWNGISNAQNGSVFTALSAIGCDSIVTLNLTVNPVVYTTENITICSNQQPYVWNGISNAQNGAVFTALSATSCDSIVTLNLTVNPVVNVTENITICSNQQPYFWNGISNAQNGSIFIAQSSAGCDSIVTLSLTINSVVNTTENLTICSNQQSYVWNGISNAPNGSVFVAQSIVGCDSFVTLNLVIGSVIPLVVHSTMQGCGVVFFQGQNYFSDTVLTDTLLTEFGCDSIINITTIELISSQPSFISKDTFVCNGFLLNNHLYTESTVLLDTISSAWGCDSIITEYNLSIETLNLTVEYSPENPYEMELINLEAKEDDAQPFSVVKWLPESVFQNNNIEKSQQIALTDATIVSAIGISTKGCYDTVSVFIQPRPYTKDIAVPNAFTPNGDGKNDVFKPVLLLDRAYVTTQFNVYNRYGQVVYSARSMNSGWDGTFNGLPVEQGVYYYTIQVYFLDKTSKQLTGEVTLIR